MKMKPVRSRIIDVVILFLMISYLIVSEVIYYRSISPGDAKHFSEFTGRLSQKDSVRVFDSPDGRLMEYRGLLPKSGLLALPSAAPVYYFDETGAFAGWVRDPGDMPIPEKFQAIGEAQFISFEKAEVRIRERSQQM